MGERTFYALREVSLQVQRGEFVAVVGPSGSGKSTLLNLIAGIDRPTSGEVWVGGWRIDTLSENALARWRGGQVGVVFQFFQLLPTLTVLENVLLPMQLRSLWGGGVDRARAHAVLERVGMSAHLHKLPSELSGGERQRVALARALANDPPILIADEPTGNLDTATGGDVIRLFREQHEAGKTVILVTHERRLANVASRRVRMLDGRIQAGDGPLTEEESVAAGPLPGAPQEEDILS
jgi:putative ABC transport system ATP-binding protein